MDYRRLALEALFRHIKPEMIIQHAYDKNIGDPVRFNHFPRAELNRVMNAHISHLSHDDISHFTDTLFNNREHINIFELLNNFADECIFAKHNEPLCRFERLFQWRLLSHQLDEDSVTTCHLAHYDLRFGIDRRDFFWPSVLRTDNIRLRNLLDREMAENHFHLQGSAPHFTLSWVAVMNRITDELYRCGKDKKNSIKEVLREMENEKLSPRLSYEKTPSMPWHSLCVAAAAIRSFLFYQAEGMPGGIIGKDLLRDLTGMEENKPYRQFVIYRKLRDSLVLPRFSYAFMLNGEPIDYAITDHGVKWNTAYKEKTNLPLFGERYLLYRTYKRIFSAGPPLLGDLLYIYLSIKLKLRAEIIQVNDKKGFANFDTYQERKDWFINGDRNLRDASYFIAVRESNNMREAVKRGPLEARIAPASNIISQRMKMSELLSLLNREYYAYEFGAVDYFEKHKKTIAPPKKPDYFFVCHFIKKKDYETADMQKTYNEKKARNIFLNQFNKCRHWKLRGEVKRQALTLMALRTEYPELARPIRGIDACANEIHCRPEVFATAFRFLSQCPVAPEHPFTKQKPLPSLNMTFHAGEDFLDMVSGLRAIQEVVLFLNLRQGSRIGHALALGLEPREWYAKKQFAVSMTKQELLDNVAWLYACMRCFNITDNLAMQLKKDFTNRFNELYVKPLNDLKARYTETEYAYDIDTYYDAWLLRGDEPMMYEDIESIYKYRKPPSLHVRDSSGSRKWSRFCENKFNIPAQPVHFDLEMLRRNTPARIINHLYHYNSAVRAKGANTEVYRITDDYINVVTRLQRHMQDWVNRHYIGIEANPSSNVMISDINHYDQHPIIKWYNIGLTGDVERLADCPQFFVSINTDDQGVFNTCLENEYALMALALEKAHDANGKPLYGVAQIYDWLDNIRKMGMEQSFI
jgi:hypothetical protein